MLTYQVKTNKIFKTHPTKVGHKVALSITNLTQIYHKAGLIEMIFYFLPCHMIKIAFQNRPLLSLPKFLVRSDFFPL